MSSILLADDNPHAQRMGSQILSQEGHTVVTVSDGDEAMQYLEDNHPDLVMVDTRMPGPSGFDICKHVKSQSKFSTVKVVLLAGPLEPFDTAEAESAGPDGVLHKPLDAYTLIDTVNSLLGQVPVVPDKGTDAEMQAAPPPPPEAPPAAPEAKAPPAEPATSTRDTASSSALAAAVSSNRGAGKPAESSAAVAELTLDLSEHFATAVEEALGTEDAHQKQRERVEAIVRDVLESAMPGLIETITDRVMRAIESE